MSFTWVRPLGMPLDHPTDDMISEYIESYDPSKFFQEEWHLWRDKMLRGRDTFHEHIPRHISLPNLSKSQITNLIFDIKHWTPLIRQVVGVMDSRLFIHKHGPDNFVCLEPIDKSDPQEPVHVKGLKVVSGRFPGWASRFKIHGCITHHPGYTEWARYVLRTERKVLGKAGIIHAIILSLFDYEYDVNLLKGLLEHWNPLTNTCYLPEEEIFPSLWDMKNVGGLPILGVRYDEYVPDERTLFGEVSYHKFRHSSSLKAVFNHYYILSRQNRGVVSITDWIMHFVSSASPFDNRIPHPCDPFGVGSENIMIQDYNPPSKPEIAAQDVDRRTFLTAFLACWLCYFVVPHKVSNRIRPEVFVMADKLAEGIQVSLASAALANLFRSLRAACASDPPGSKDTLIPLHYLFGWLSMQFQFLYSIVVSESMRSKLPFLIHIANAFPVRFKSHEVRLIFRGFEKYGHCRNIFPNTRGLLPDQAEHYDNDFGVLANDFGVLVPRHRISLEFLISIRVGLLPFRCGNLTSLEVYNPHRCARQFGFDQVIPENVIDINNFSEDIYAIAECWHTLLRYGTSSFYIVPSCKRSPQCSFKYLSWRVMHLKEYDGYPFSEIFSSSNKSQKKKISSNTPVHPTIDFGLNLSESSSCKRLKRSISGEEPPILVEDVEEDVSSYGYALHDVSESSSSDDFVIEAQSDSHSSFPERESIEPIGSERGVITGGISPLRENKQRCSGEGDALAKHENQQGSSDETIEALEVVQIPIKPLEDVLPMMEAINPGIGACKDADQQNNPQASSTNGEQVLSQDVDNTLKNAVGSQILLQSFANVDASKSEGVHCLLEHTARSLVINFLDALCTKSEFPSSDDFQNSSKIISNTMISLGVHHDTWEELSQEIWSNLQQIKLDQASVQVCCPEHDLQVGQIRKNLQDLDDIKSSLESEKQARLTSCQHLVAKIECVNEEIKRLMEKKDLIVLELHKEQDSLATVETKELDNRGLIQKCQAEVAALEELQKSAHVACLEIATRVEGRKLALRETIKDFLQHY